MKRHLLASLLLLVCLVCTACSAGGGAGRERPEGALAKPAGSGQPAEPPALPTRAAAAQAPGGEPTRSVALPGVAAQRTPQPGAAATLGAAAQATLPAPTNQVALPGVLGQRTRALTPQGAIQRTPSWTPGANVTKEVAAVAPQQAQEALGAAIQALKGKAARVTQAQGYTGSASVPLPPAMQGAFAAVLGANATGYYGLYNGANLAVTASAASDQAAGAMTLLIEPKAALPASADQAQTQLKQWFAGAPTALAPVPQVESLGLPAGYAFYALDGSTAYLLGMAAVEGQTAAYAIKGSGSYQALVPKP